MGKILLPIPGAPITQKFNVKSAHDATHIHGAVDLGASVGTQIIAPEDGFVYGWQAIRPKEAMYWPEQPSVLDWAKYTFGNYFYDMYGAVTVLVAKDRTHLFCHAYGSQVFNKMFPNAKRFYVEQKADDRFPIFAHYTDKVQVKAGDPIALVGHAGFNLGAHLHWEIHSGNNNCQSYPDRIDPETLL